MSLADVDSLIGVMGRQVGLAAVQREMDRSERDGESLVLAFVDTVGLKAINDTQGHAAGDRVLQDVAGCITDDLRSYDLVTRVGGDEFVSTLSGQCVAQAGARYEKMALRLAERTSGVRMTFGLAVFGLETRLASWSIEPIRRWWRVANDTAEVGAGPGRDDDAAALLHRRDDPPRDPVSDHYASVDCDFTGGIEWVEIDVEEAAEDADHLISPEERLRVALARQ